MKGLTILNLTTSFLSFWYSIWTNEMKICHNLSKNLFALNLIVQFRYFIGVSVILLGLAVSACLCQVFMSESVRYGP
jgi:hypothetical protein